jgi:V/A-type H+-transporting ATPase subunit C
MTTRVKRYAFINAKLRARLAQLISDDVLHNLMGAPTLHDALVLLRETPFAYLEDLYNRTGDLKLGEVTLFKHEIELYRELEKYLDEEVLGTVRALALNYEIENLKNGLRIFFDRTVHGRDVREAVSYLYFGRVEHDIDIRQIAEAEKLDEVITALQDSPYARIVERHREAILEEKTLFRLEVAFDRFYFDNLVQKAGDLNSRDRETALRLIGIEIDLLNINWIIRLRSFYRLPMDTAMGFLIPHGFNIGEDAVKEAYASENLVKILQGIIRKKYPGLATLLTASTGDTYSRLLLVERILDQILQLEIGRIRSGYPFSIGIVLAYFILKRNETRKITTVLNAKQYNLSEDRIGEIV